MADQNQQESQPSGSVSKPEPGRLMKLSQSDFEIDFFERVLQRTPNNTDILKILGDYYTAKGLYTRGLQVDKRLVKLLPEDGVVWYNLACSYSLLHLTDLAISSLARSFELGYDDVEHILTDGDLDNIRDDPRFRKLVAKLEGRPTD